MHSDYIVFVDESGDHSLAKVDRDFPLFSLCLCVIRKAVYISNLIPRIKQIKFDAFGHDCVILHEADIRRKRGHFSMLGREPRERFMNELTTAIEETDMTVVAVVIDKRRLTERYRRPHNPYHLGVQYGLERVRHFLSLRAQHELLTHIVCEARGRKEDVDLELQFRRICDGDNIEHAAYSFDIVICDKKANSEGLQLADLMARPIALHVLRPGQANRAFNVLQRKFFTGASGSIAGNGLKVYP